MDTNSKPVGNGHGSANLAPDATLVHAARQGDKRAFVEIVARHQAMVTGIGLAILKDFAASEDAAQEAFLTAWRKIHDLQEPSRLRAWLGQIARNAALGYLRRQHPESPLDELEAFPDSAPSPDAIAASEEEAAIVRDALGKLPQIYRLPLILFYREGQSIRAVAEALEISEDAVKQRLARGREMLKDRVSGVIETVLEKTRPNAVFTMTIAAAIGALTAPALLAGTVFSAAAATATTTASSTAVAAASAPASTTTTSTLITFMSTTKGLVATAAFVTILCIPIGYQLAPDSEAKLTPPPPSLPITAPVQRVLDLQHSALFAEWRRLHEIHGTNAAAMPALYQAITDLKDNFRRRAFRAALIAEWVQVDPQGGLSFFIRGKDSAQRKQFFEEWLALNPRAAVEALMAEPGYERLAQECLVEIARKVPDRVLEIITDIPKPDSYWDTSIRDAVAILAGSNLEATRTAVEQLEGANRAQALAGVARAWGKTDLGSALEWAKKLPKSEEIDRDEIVRSAIYGKATVDPVAALEQVGAAPPGGRSGYFADTMGAKLLKEASAADFDSTVRWLVENPGRLGHEDLLGMAGSVTERLNADPITFLNQHAMEGSLSALIAPISSALLNDGAGQRAMIWDWLKTQPESPVTTQLREQVLSSASFQDPQLALQFAADLPNGGTTQQFEQVARSLFNGGMALHRFDKLMQDAPPKMREPLIKAAFESLRPEEAFGDPNVWIARLNQLPETSRGFGMEAIARAWATKAPEEAVGWVATQPAGELRAGAVGALTGAWANQDPHAAAAWISALPPGQDRDRGALELALNLAEHHPNEGWQWAVSISEPKDRAAAAERFIRHLPARQSGTARQLIEGANLDPDLKAKLHARLDEVTQGHKH